MKYSLHMRYSLWGFDAQFENYYLSFVDCPCIVRGLSAHHVRYVAALYKYSLAIPYPPRFDTVQVPVVRLCLHDKQSQLENGSQGYKHDTPPEDPRSGS